MSLVGPRPERPELQKEIEKEVPEFGLRLQAKAGLTGYAQVYGKYNTTFYGLLLNILKPHREVAFSSIEGYFLTFGNFIITIGLCAIVIELLKQNVFLKKLLSIK